MPDTVAWLVGVRSERLLRTAFMHIAEFINEVVWTTPSKALLVHIVFREVAHLHCTFRMDDSFIQHMTAYNNVNVCCLYPLSAILS